MVDDKTTDYEVTILKALIENFDMDGLRVIAHYCHIDWDQLGGDTKSNKAIAILLFSTRTGRMQQLSEAMNWWQSGESDGKLLDGVDIPDGKQQILNSLKRNEETQLVKEKAEYFKELDDWMLDRNIHESKPMDSVRLVAKDRTHRILKILDKAGKNEVLRVLYARKLIGHSAPIDLSEADLRETNLDGLDLSRIDLSKANLSGTSLRGTILKRSNLNGANLSRAILGEVAPASIESPPTDLTEANLGEADLTGAQIADNTVLDKVVLRGVKINEETKISKKWRLVWRLVNQDVNQESGGKIGPDDKEHLDLRDVDLDGANLEKTTLSRVDLTRATLRKSILRGVTFESVILADAILEGADLTDAVFTKETKLTGANLTGAILLRTNLSGLNIERTIFRKAMFIKANRVHSFCNRALYWFSYLREAAHNKRFLETGFLGTDGAVLARANICKADFTEAIIAPRQLTGEKQVLTDIILPDGVKFSSETVPSHRVELPKC